MLALHARRSSGTIAAYRERFPKAPLAVVLTGTDLYRDLPGDPDARRSLDLADRIVVLQDDAPRCLPRAWRRKCEVIFQSASPVKAARGRARDLRCVVVGHLREEKDPATLFEAIRKLPPDIPIRIRHIGGGLDPELQAAAFQLARDEPRYRYAGALSHRATRAAIAMADVLVHPSRMEGGANVIAEAMTAGTPVIASRMSGNVGMLGRGYGGYFPVGDAAALSRRLSRAATDSGYLFGLRAQCRERKPIFSPSRERKALCELVARLLAQARR